MNEIEIEINMLQFRSMHTSLILIQCSDTEGVTELDTVHKQ
jgi:hypothetical protein